METKACKKCGEIFPLTSEYYRSHKKCKDGFENTCKGCTSLNKKEWASNNKERIKETREKYRIRNADRIKRVKKEWDDSHKEHNKEVYHQWWVANAETKREQSAQWKKDNPDKVKEYKLKNKEHIIKARKKYRIDNIDKIKKYNKLYKSNNKILVNMSTQKRQALKKSLPATLTFLEWEYIKDLFGHTCAYCGKELFLTQDHFIPLSKGGGYELGNIIPSCLSCNSSKCANDFNTWYPRQDYYSKQREQKILKFLNHKDGIQQLSMI